MQLKTLISKIPTEMVIGTLDREITSLCYDSRRVQKGALFVALRGSKVDGASFIDSAIERGAVAVVCEQEHPARKATQIIVKDARVALADLAREFHGDPSSRLRVAGITGTNGKTTTGFLLKHLCEAGMLRCGLIGTIGYEIGDRVLPAQNTTPESADLQDLLAQIEHSGGRAAVMEASSHAIDQGRVRNIEFDVAIYTNLTQDHLDYHRNIESYFDAKAKLFTGLAGQQKKKKAKAVVNIDDTHGRALLQRLANEGVDAVTYGMGANADFRASNVRMEISGTQYELEARGRKYLVRLPLIGAFNVYNSLAALAGAVVMGVELRLAIKALADAPSVPGRLQPVPVMRQFRVFVDYAHTDDALTNVMRTLRDLSPRRLIVVFGCGGSRDRAKRPLMAAAVEKLADWAIVTSDNPRKEDPEAIINEVKTGFRGANYEIVVDRRDAIYKAISLAQPRDIVLIAGKGHETYQEFADHTIPFDDLAIARLAVEAKPVELEPRFPEGERREFRETREPRERDPRERDPRDTRGFGDRRDPRDRRDARPPRFPRDQRPERRPGDERHD